MRLFLVIILGLGVFNSSMKEQNITGKENVVVAHRGAWKHLELPENSIASLKHAITLKCAGSEFDVRMTADDVLVVNHDKDYSGLLIEETTYAELANYTLSNGEKLPTLKDYIRVGMESNTSTGLVCEIKPSKTKERGKSIAEKVLRLVSELKAEAFVTSYISFDYDILKKIVELNPEIPTQYLGGEKSPEELIADGISGLDYPINAFKKHPEWIQSAKEKGLSLNVWTVNKQEEMDWFLDNGFDYITTDEPELLFERIKVRSNSGK